MLRNLELSFIKYWEVYPSEVKRREILDKNKGQYNMLKGLSFLNDYF